MKDTKDKSNDIDAKLQTLISETQNVNEQLRNHSEDVKEFDENIQRIGRSIDSIELKREISNLQTFNVFTCCLFYRATKRVIEEKQQKLNQLEQELSLNPMKKC